MTEPTKKDQMEAGFRKWLDSPFTKLAIDGARLEAETIAPLLRTAYESGFVMGSVNTLVSMLAPKTD